MKQVLVGTFVVKVDDVTDLEAKEVVKLALEKFGVVQDLYVTSAREE